MNRHILRNIIFSGLFLVPFIPFLVSGSLFFPFITTKGYAFRIIVEIVFAAWALLALSDSEARPKKTWIFSAVWIFIAIVGLADIVGVAPVKSFWSNSERMEGFVGLLHLGMYFTVIVSVFKQIDWRRWWNTSIGAAFLMSIYCAFQILGVFEIHQSASRVDGTFGNAAYLAVYMLIHVFIALYYMVKARGGMRWVYTAFTAIFSLILYYTATRGAILGLLGGLLVVAVLSVWNKESAFMRRLGIAYVVGFVVLVGGFIAVRNTSFVQSSPVLVRFANLGTAQIKTEGRSFVWPMAVQGMKERPILGWGQENFNYVFNEHYKPQMYGLEPWFDRAHNIFLDWGTQAGVLGLFAYLSLYVLLLIYVWKKGEGYTYADKSILTGLLSAYFFHNLFVFDHLISYILFFSLLAFAAERGTERRVRESHSYDGESVKNIGMPLVLIIAVAVLYVVNIKPIMANTSLISALSALQSGNASRAMSSFEGAYSGARLGRPEVTEQIASNAPNILRSNLISMEEKNGFFSFARTAVEKQAADLPTDARYQLLAGTFLTETGQFDAALTYLKRAQELTPGKQIVYLQIATAEIGKGNTAVGLAALKQAYEMEPNYLEAEMSYLVGAIYAGDTALERELAADIEKKSPQSLNDDRIVSAYLSMKRYGELVSVLNRRIANDPGNPQAYINLAAAYVEMNDTQNAIRVLREFAAKLPQYKPQADSYIQAIQNGTIQ